MLASDGQTGGRLSNTWTTYPWVRDNPGKLGLIPDGTSLAGMQDVRKLRRPRMGLRPIR